MSSKQKLELTWIGKEDRPKLEPRILVEVPEKSYRAKEKHGENDIFDNMLIHGDNLLALKALESKFAGQIKCIYIDPPFNTGKAFDHYDDCLEHSIWLGLMRERLEILSKLLAEDGFFCCHIDDSETSYLKVLLDEVFGYHNFLSTIYVKVRYEGKTLTKDMVFHKEIEQIHIYRKTVKSRPILNTVEKKDDKYCYYFTVSPQGTEISLGGKKVVVYKEGEYSISKREPSSEGRKEIWASGSVLEKNSSGRFFRDYLAGRSVTDGLKVLYKVYGVGDEPSGYRYFTGPCKKNAIRGKYYQGMPISQTKENQTETSPIANFYDLAAQFGNCNHEGGVSFRNGKKPELLIKMILQHFSSPGDIVLDSFLGSGTTAAVAHKMGRRWIGIELGDHCYTHCLPRLQRVVDGTDQAGISEVVDWHGGGGFRFYELGESVIDVDDWGQKVINDKFTPDMLIEAVCKVEGFTYAPSKEEYFIHGYSSEQSFIYVTANYVKADVLHSLSEQLGPKRFLTVYCTGFDEVSELDNIIVKKIPESILKKFEIGRDNYDLNVQAAAEEDAR